MLAFFQADACIVSKVFVRFLLHNCRTFCLVSASCSPSAMAPSVKPQEQFVSFRKIVCLLVFMFAIRRHSKQRILSVECLAGAFHAVCSPESKTRS